MKNIKNINCDRKIEIKIGRKIEMEHASLFPKKTQYKMAVKIAADRIDEFPCYYTKGLLPMEKKLKIKKLKGGIRKNVYKK